MGTFEIGNTVQVGSKQSGRITAIMTDEHAVTSYCVRYFDTLGIKHDDWFEAHELSTPYAAKEL